MKSEQVTKSFKAKTDKDHRQGACMAQMLHIEYFIKTNKGYIHLWIAHRAAII